MCTVSIVDSREGLRLICNRDERLTRSEAFAPERIRLGSTIATYPVDPDGGGTWVGVNDARLAAVLLNRRGAEVGARVNRRSRGEIVVRALHAETLEQAEEDVRRVDVAAYEPFHLLIVQRSSILVAYSDARVLRVTRRTIDGPIMFTASSLGDELVERVRRPLFHHTVCRAADPIAGQRLFHDHQWPSAPEISVRMRRADARTVSRTSIDLTESVVSLQYEPLHHP